MQIKKIIVITFLIFSTNVFSQVNQQKTTGFFLFPVKTLGDIDRIQRNIEFGYINKNFSFPEIKSLKTIRFYQYYQTGIASWYGPGFQGRRTANGEIYDMYALTAAHKTLPFNTLVKVTNLKNNLSVVVRINDRGPFIKGRVIDLSKTAKNSIGMDGLAQVTLEIVKK